VNAENFGSSFFGSSFASFSGAYELMGKMLAQQSWKPEAVISCIYDNSKLSENNAVHQWVSQHWMLHNTNLISSISTRAKNKLSCGLS
jgi:hypothetical protein